ncbi:helix-turn-helix transcriptional regulator [Longispora sp. K20-0274]|uniref:helix-turn-helix domain-containing protein n=1 Tax=Longispora sp. K20-0274 TaxID=3088255 RepID=UPI00399B57C9
MSTEPLGLPLLWPAVLRAGLADERKRAGMSQAYVAARLRWSPSKVLRIERGNHGVSYTDVRAMLNLYGSGDEVAEELLGLADAIARNDGLGMAKHLVSPQVVQLMRLEAMASRIQQFEIVMVPGVLQTDRYARTVIRGLCPAEDTDAVVAAKTAMRLQRGQRLLGREDNPSLTYVLYEAVFRAGVGGPDVMAEQVAHLLRVNEAPNVDIRVLPASVGVFRAMNGAFMIMDFDSPDEPSALYTDGHRADSVSREEPVELAGTREAFVEMEGQSVPLPVFLEEYRP